MKSISSKFFARSSNLALAACGILAFVLYLFLGRLGLAGEPNRLATALPLFFALLAALFFLLLFAAMMVKRSAPRQNQAQWPLMIIAVFAVLFRLALLGQMPWLSNDICRYLWDALLVDHGINPYAFPPAANELAEFRDAVIYPKMDHKYVHSVYPPFLQLLFWTGRQASRILTLAPAAGLKLIFVLIDLGLVLALFRLLAQMNLDPRWAVLYAWHPLPIVEIAGSGHTDTAGALTLVLAMAFLRQRQYFFVAFFLALGFLVKFISALFLPFLLVAMWKDAGFKKAALGIAVFVFLIAGSYIPFASAGEKIISGLAAYSAKWRFNDGFFSLVFAGIHRLLPDWLVTDLMIPPTWEINEITLATRRIDLALLVSKTITGVVFAFIYFRLVFRQIKSKAHQTLENWPAIFAIILSAFFLLSPTLQPWYLIWLLPLLCLSYATNEFEFFQPMIPAFWLLSATVFLSYWGLAGYLQSGVWREPGWVKWAEYGIPLALWLWCFKTRFNQPVTKTSVVSKVL